MADNRLVNGLLVVGGILCFLLGVRVFQAASGGMVAGLGFALVTVALFLLGALLLAVPVSRALSMPFGSLLFPDQRLPRAPPLYSLAEAQVKRKQYAEAMITYRGIAESYPEEVKPWIDMIDIAIVHYHDPDQANQIFQEGIRVLEDPDARDTLSKMYRAIASRIAEKPSWQQARTLEITGSEPLPPSPPRRHGRKTLHRNESGE